MLIVYLLVHVSSKCSFYLFIKPLITSTLCTQSFQRGDFNIINYMLIYYVKNINILTLKDF